MFVRILPPEVRSKIAAGEVIESPADVVKELVENALDAKATRIEVELSKGGKRLILVRDNGTGIHPQDVEKVFLEGATSKIESDRDLLNLNTYGFRGEALHSIASVSRLTIRTRFFQESKGYELELEGGEIVSKRVVGMPVGTEVEVRDLFYNVPVRRKFLRREDTERSKAVKLLREYALVNPEVGLVLFSNAREVLNLRPSEERERVEEVLGEKTELLKGEREFLKVRAYIRRNVPRGEFFLFVNSRPVSMRGMKDFLRKVLGYKTLGVVFLEIPPFMVDFNVHPKKREAKFIKERKVLSLLREILSFREERPEFVLGQEVPKYETEFKLLGQVNDTLILAQRGDYLYFFDQHLISERAHYERLGGRRDADEIACRSALKSGEKLSEREMRELLEEWKSLENPHVCPHGRPIYYRVHLKEIYEKLGRSF
ncbi:DNA mismatch repair endonuclease MutL [Hydrogenivirga sp.]